MNCTTCGWEITATFPDGRPRIYHHKRTGPPECGTCNAWRNNHHGQPRPQHIIDRHHDRLYHHANQVLEANQRFA